MKKLDILLLSLAFTVLPVASHAQEKEEGSYTLENKLELRRIDLKRADLDKDGLTTYEELMNDALKRFGGIDVNRDGFIGNGELVDYINAYRMRFGATFGKAEDNQMRRLTQLYQRMDKNKDTRISRAEFTSFYEQRYGLFDRNGDGAISDLEYRMDIERMPYIAR